jgi:DNA-binding NarL/FixJ family response regulator
LPKARVRVLLADDHPLMRAGIAQTLSKEKDIDLVGEAADAQDARRQALALRPDVLLLDVSMPGPRAAETVVYLKKHCPETRVVALTAYDDDVYVTALVDAGVYGYVLKDEPPEAVLRAVRTVAEGESWFSSSIMERLNRRKTSAARLSATLTPRETEVLRMVMEGHTDREMGDALGLAERTVRYHLTSIFNKLGVNSRPEAVAHAIERGLIRPRSEGLGPNR